MPRSQVYEYDASKMTYQQAALCEPFTIGLQANWRGDVRPGDVVLVHGGGPIGLIVANIAKSRGATVIVSEPNESRLAMAKDFGADYSINPMKEDLDAFINKLTDGEGVNVIFEAAGVPALLAHATSQLSPAGPSGGYDLWQGADPRELQGDQRKGTDHSGYPSSVPEVPRGGQDPA